MNTPMSALSSVWNDLESHGSLSGKLPKLADKSLPLHFCPHFPGGYSHNFVRIATTNTVAGEMVAE